MAVMIYAKKMDSQLGGNIHHATQPLSQERAFTHSDPKHTKADKPAQKHELGCGKKTQQFTDWMLKSVKSRCIEALVAMNQRLLNLRILHF